MGVLDAILQIGGGLTRGYRASQEVQRRMDEANRRVLLEQEELGIKRREAESQNALRSSQIEDLILQGSLASEREKRDSGAFAAGQRPLEAGGSAAGVLRKAGILNPTISDADKFAETINRALYPNQYIHYPPIDRGLTDTERALQAWMSVADNVVSQYEIDPVKRATAILNFLHNAPPDVQKSFFGQADTTSISSPKRKSTKGR